MLPGDGPQRLKEAERHERGEDVRLDPVVQLVVDGPEAEVVLQLSERILDLALDHVPLPERLRVAFREVRAQEIGSLVVRAGLADAVPVELPLEGLGSDLLAFLRNRDGYHLPRSARLRSRDRKALDQLVARQLALRGLRLPPLRPADAPVESEERLHRAADPLRAHRGLLERTRRAAREDERVARNRRLLAVRGLRRHVVRLRHLHVDAFLHVLPVRLLQLVSEHLQVSARSADEIPVPAFAHLPQRLLRRNAPVHQPEAADLPVLLLQPPDERHLRLLVARVAGHDLVGEGEAVRREDERDHDLQAVAPLVAAVAVALEVALEGLRAVDLEVRAREVEEEDVARRAEEPRPPVAEEVEELVLERSFPFAARLLPFVGVPDHPVEAAVESGPPCERTGADQLLDRRVREPVRVHPEFAPGIREAVEDDGLHECEPVRPLAARTEA